MKKHIAASGARAGQWVNCTAAKNCRNGGTHTDDKTLQLVQDWKNNSSSRYVALKTLDLQDLEDFNALPGSLQSSYAKNRAFKDAEARKPENVAKREAARKAAYQRRNGKLTDADRQALDNVTKFFGTPKKPQQKAPVKKATPAYKTVAYTSRYGDTRTFDAELVDYGQDKQVLRAFFFKAQVCSISRGRGNEIDLRNFIAENQKTINKHVPQEQINQFLSDGNKTQNELPEYERYWRHNAKDVSDSVPINTRNILGQTHFPTPIMTMKDRVKNLFSEVTGKAKTTASSVKVSQSATPPEGYVTPAEQLSKKIDSLFARR